MSQPIVIVQGTTQDIVAMNIRIDGQLVDPTGWTIHAVLRRDHVQGAIVATWRDIPGPGEGLAEVLPANLAIDPEAAGQKWVYLHIIPAMSSAWTFSRGVVHAEVKEPTGSLLLDPSGIISSEAPGAASAGVIVAPGAILGGEAFGPSTVALAAIVVAPSGIESGQAPGFPVLVGLVTLAPTGIPGSEAFGPPSIATGVIILNPASIASGELFGTVGSGVPVSISPIGIPSSSAVGGGKVVLVTITTGWPPRAGSVVVVGLATADIAITGTVTSTVSVT